MNPSTIAVSSVDDQPRDIPAPANRSYFPALDGIRCLAFLMVFAQHYAHTPWGWTGVDVFFVLSGFLITGILYDTADQPHRARNFYVRRTLRIFPLYYGVMVLIVLAYPIMHWRFTWGWLLWPAYFGNFLRGLTAYAPNSPMQLLADFQPLSRSVHGFRLALGHFWSLCVEEQFYLFWPWVVFAVRDRRKLIGICTAAVIICPLLRIWGNHTFPQYMLDQEVLYRWTPFRVDALLLGGLVALLERGPARKDLLRFARIVLAVMTVVAAIWYGHSWLVQRHGDYIYPSWRFTWGLVFVDVFSACLIVAALEPQTWVYRLFHLSPLRWVGRVSYGAYVFHDIFHAEIQALADHLHFRHQERFSVAVALIITLALSWASYRFYEAPFIRLKDRLAPSSSARLREPPLVVKA